MLSVANVDVETNLSVPHSTEVVDTYAVLHMIEFDPESACKNAVGEGSVPPKSVPTIVMVNPPLSGVLYLNAPVIVPPARGRVTPQWHTCTRSLGS